MKHEGFTLDKREGIAVLTLNRPEKLNAITEEMFIKVFPKLFRELNADDTVRVLIITGAGKGFCAGADVSEMATGVTFQSGLTREERLQAIGAFTVLLYNLEKPVISAINGVAAGAGISLALLSDIRIASENARFSLVFVRRGLVPDGGATFLLPRLVGEAKSFELMYTGDIIDAREAERIGLVNKVVPAANLMDEAFSLAKKLAEGPPLTLAQIKRATHRGIMNSLEEQLYFESYAQNFCMRTEDHKEGVKSFLEKREPKFVGH